MTEQREATNAGLNQGFEPEEIIIGDPDQLLVPLDESVIKGIIEGAPRRRLELSSEQKELIAAEVGKAARAFLLKIRDASLGDIDSQKAGAIVLGLRAYLLSTVGSALQLYSRGSNANLSPIGVTDIQGGLNGLSDLRPGMQTLASEVIAVSNSGHSRRLVVVWDPTDMRVNILLGNWGEEVPAPSAPSTPNNPVASEPVSGA